MEENNKTMEIETNNMKKHISILTTVFIIVFVMMAAGLVFSNAYWYDRHLKDTKQISDLEKTLTKDGEERLNELQRVADYYADGEAHQEIVEVCDNVTRCTENVYDVLCAAHNALKDKNFSKDDVQYYTNLIDNARKEYDVAIDKYKDISHSELNIYDVIYITDTTIRMAKFGDDITNVNNEKDSYTDTNTNTTQNKNIRPEFQKAMDEYEAFFDEWTNYMSGISNGEINIADMNSMIKRYNDMEEALKNWDTKDMTSDEFELYTKVSGKILSDIYRASEK